jgi:Amt family ammonium transporter
MTPGLAFFYAGMVRRKNAAATIMHSFMCIALVGVVWVLWGYSLAFGDDVGGGLLGGLEHLGLAGVSAVAADGENISEQTFMIFQAMFAIITPALITGAFAERMKFSSFVIFTVLWVTIVYAPVAHWVWHSDGWLFQLGALDFAGGTVVHMNAGFAALAAAWVIFGRRKGYGTDSMPPHNVPFVVLGAALLWFGWFGPRALWLDWSPLHRPLDLLGLCPPLPLESEPECSAISQSSSSITFALMTL